MRLRPSELFLALWRMARLSRRSSRARELERDLLEQSGEDYWKKRARSQSRQRRLDAIRSQLDSRRTGLLEYGSILRKSFLPAILGASKGGLLLVAVLAAEMVLGRHYPPLLIPSADSAPFLASFPTLAVQVSASLLGFYLASVSIVLGRNYSDVSANVRELVLGNPRSRVYLTAIGFAIGPGLLIGRNNITRLDRAEGSDPIALDDWEAARRLLPSERKRSSATTHPLLWRRF